MTGPGLGGGGRSWSGGEVMLLQSLMVLGKTVQYFHQLFSCLYRSASIRLHPFQTPPFILGHTHPPYSFSSKLSHLFKEHSPSQGQLNGIYCLMNSDTPNLLLHLKQLSKPISSDLPTNLLCLLDALCVCVCVRAHVRVCVCVCVWCADPIILVFFCCCCFPGVEYGFLCVYNVM